uniref:Homeobox domain-containing protein n=1 Tax=Steinernema glaseri TaxID=37863 RepID=A0A1I8ABH4_9BILA
MKAVEQATEEASTKIEEVSTQFFIVHIALGLPNLVSLHVPIESSKGRSAMTDVDAFSFVEFGLMELSSNDGMSVTAMFFDLTIRKPVTQTKKYITSRKIQAKSTCTLATDHHDHDDLQRSTTAVHLQESRVKNKKEVSMDRRKLDYWFSKKMELNAMRTLADHEDCEGQ